MFNSYYAIYCLILVIDSKQIQILRKLVCISEINCWRNWNFCFWKHSNPKIHRLKWLNEEPYVFLCPLVIDKLILCPILSLNLRNQLITSPLSFNLSSLKISSFYQLNFYIIWLLLNQIFKVNFYRIGICNS